MSVESFGRLEAPSLTLLGSLAGLASLGLLSSWGRSGSLALPWHRATPSLPVCRSGAYVATRAAGRTPMSGLARPSTTVVRACFEPCMWVWVFLFGFALRCVALLCAVCVRLHLACFRLAGHAEASVC
jgi:hypothetical protein